MCVGNKLPDKGVKFLKTKGILISIVSPDNTKVRATKIILSYYFPSVKKYQSKTFKTIKQRR